MTKFEWPKFLKKLERVVRSSMSCNKPKPSLTSTSYDCQPAVYKAQNLILRVSMYKIGRIGYNISAKAIQHSDSSTIEVTKSIKCVAASF